MIGICNKHYITVCLYAWTFVALFNDILMVTDCNVYTYKYKNHFNEMKGDVGMSDQQK